jgi:alkylation response protein AidB-like acyl-CoA dehydrogenase
MPALDNEERMLLETVRDLAEEEFAEKALTWEESHPWENLELLADRGFLGISLDEKYGGGGMSEYVAIRMCEEIGRVCPDTAGAVAESQLVAPRAVDMFGTEAAKEKYLPPVLNGKARMAVAISEPEAGSDARAMNTHVEEVDGELVLNGEKIWVSGVPESEAAVVWTKFPEGGLGTLIIEFDWPGVEIQQHYTNMANHTQTHFYMEDVVVPEENVLVRGEKAFKQQLQSLNWERMGNCTIGLSQAMKAFDLALEYSQSREQFGQPIGDFQGMEWKLADMATQLSAARSLVHDVASTAHEEDRAPTRLEAAMSKLFTAQMAEDVVSEALQVHGANGYQQGHPVEYLYRQVRGRRIGAGTDEMMRNQIASYIKKHGLE